MGVGEVASKGVRKGNVVDIERAAEAAAEAVDAAERMAGVPITGAVVGIAGAAALSAVMVHTFTGVKASDPVSYAAVVAMLAAAVALASAVPARRAARVDPVRALRWE